MAAGLGFKDFQTGEVLTAADVDGYLMQGIWVFASATARDAAVTSPQEGNACYLKDTNEVLTYSGSAWVAVGGAAGASYAVFRDEKTNGTAGGTQTSGSFLTRDLNTTQFNNITGASLSSNQVTLAAGTYYVDAIAPQKGPQGALRWYNITDSSVAVAGQTNYFEAWGEFKLFGYFTIAAQKVFELQYRSSATEAGNGLGVAKSFSIPEVYAMVSLVKVA
jgi:hypothetical protein